MWKLFSVTCAWFSILGECVFLEIVWAVEVYVSAASLLVWLLAMN